MPAALTTFLLATADRPRLAEGLGAWLLYKDG
jgi:hypothetical protein